MKHVAKSKFYKSRNRALADVLKMATSTPSKRLILSCANELQRPLGLRLIISYNYHSIYQAIITAQI
jgi:hypothetical protein